MKDPIDTKTADLITAKYGLLPGDRAMTAKERMAKFRQTKKQLNVSIENDLFDELEAFVERNNLTKTEAIDRLLRAQLLRKR